MKFVIHPSGYLAQVGAEGNWEGARRGGMDQNPWQWQALARQSPRTKSPQLTSGVTSRWAVCLGGCSGKALLKSRPTFSRFPSGKISQCSVIYVGHCIMKNGRRTLTKESEFSTSGPVDQVEELFSYLKSSTIAI
jgi:hypothetical protein